MGLIDDTQVPGYKKVISKKTVAALLIGAICALVVWHFNGGRTFFKV